MKEIEKTLQTYFLDKAPKMPTDLQKVIVQYGPYLLLLGVIFSAIGVMSAFGFGFGVYNPYRALVTGSFGFMYNIYLAFSILILVLEALALPGLFNKQMQGWRYIFYAVIASTVMYIVTFNIAGLIIGSGLGFYILFQIKRHYK